MTSYIWADWDRMLAWNIERMEGRAYASYEVW